MTCPLYSSLSLARAAGVLLAWLCLAGAAQAANGKFDGDPVDYCSNPSGPTYDSATRTYTCDPLPAGVDIWISSGYTLVIRSSMTFDYHQRLRMDGSAKLYVKGDLNMANIQSSHVDVEGGNLVADGVFSMGAQPQEITANVTAASINIGTGTGAATLVNGTLTATGPITLAANVTVMGDVAGADLTMHASGVVVTGNVNVNGNLLMGSGDTINGNVVVSGNVTMQDSNAYISGALSANTVVLGYAGRVGQTITCTGALPTDAPCSCVTNNSGYPVNTTNGPKCTAPAASGPHHIHIEHPATALTCQPTAVTVTACANAACTAPHFSAGVNVTLNPGGLTFAIDSGGVNDRATVQPPSAATVALTALSSLPALAASTCYKSGPNASDCNISGVESGLTLSVPDHIAETSQTLTVQALQSGGNNQSCVPLFKDISRTINFSCVYDNPSGGSAAVRLNGTPLAAGPVAACTPAGANLALPFDANGKATASLLYSDVGALTLKAKYTGSVGNASGVVVGSGAFIAAPARFEFTIKKAADATVLNPAATTAAGTAFIKAGEKFSGVLKVLNAIGNPTPNFGKEIPAESYSITQAIVLPANGVNPAVDGNFKALVGGVSPAADMRWDEVGSFSFKAVLNNTGGYLGAGQANFLTAGSVNVGRFVPSHFNTRVISDAALAHTPMACAAAMGCPASFNNYVFSAQPVLLEATAYALTGTVTRNYSFAAGLAKQVDLTAWGLLNTSGATEQSGSANPGGGNIIDDVDYDPYIPASSFANGVGQAAIKYKFAAGKAAPANVYFRAADAEATSLRSSGTSEGGVAVVSGRLLVDNAHGSAQYAMPVTLRAQYWDGVSYLNSGLDTLVSPQALRPLLSGKLSFSNCKKGLLQADGSCTALALADADNGLQFVSGKVKFRLAKPGVAGSTYLGVSAVPYLPPAAGMLSFGVYDSGPVIYLREVY